MSKKILSIIIGLLLVIQISFVGVFNIPTAQAATYTFTEIFSTTTYKDSVNTTADWNTDTETIKLPSEDETYIISAMVQSLKINTTSKKIIKARLTADDTIQGNMGLNYLFSADGGDAKNG